MSGSDAKEQASSGYAKLDLAVLQLQSMYKKLQELLSGPIAAGCYHLPDSVFEHDHE